MGSKNIQIFDRLWSFFFRSLCQRPKNLVQLRELLFQDDRPPPWGGEAVNGPAGEHCFSRGIIGHLVPDNQFHTPEFLHPYLDADRVVEGGGMLIPALHADDWGNNPLPLQPI